MDAREIVAYFRVSTQEQGLHGLGMAAQRFTVQAYAERNGWPIVGSYEEVETGRKDHLVNRPQLVRAVAHARRSGALLVIARIDRLARSVLVTSQLLESGVEFVACDNPHANRLTIHILAAMAEHEGRLISERTKAGLAAARARGVTFGNGGRYLTLEARTKGQLAAKLAHVARAKRAYADLVPLITELRKGGHSMRSIAAHLNETGHRNQRRNRVTISNVRAIFIREGMSYLTNILGPNRNITPTIQRMGAEAAGLKSKAQAKAAYAHMAPSIIEQYRTGATISSIARSLNAAGHQTQHFGRFYPSMVRGILVREGVPSPDISSIAFTARTQAAGVAAAAIANRVRARNNRAKNLPLATKLRNTGKTLKEIAAELNRRRRRTPRGRKWSSGSVWTLLNVSYD